MGIKENFSQAIRELTGGEKEDRRSDKSTVDGMRSAVAAEDTGEFTAITAAAAAAGEEPPRDEFEEIERRAAEAAEAYNRRQGEFDGMRPTESAPAFEQGAGFGAPQEPSFGQPQNPSGAQEQQNPFGESAPNSFGQAASQGQNPAFGQTPPPEAGSGASGYPNGASPEPMPSPVSFSTAAYRPVDENEITVISKNTVVDGNIRSFANMTIDGNIKGNVETTKDIDLNGKVVGNIACNNAALRTSQVQGNVQMKGNVFMERDTLLIGDISSTYANVNGKIKGNLEITGKAELKSDAVVFGDISASTITVNDGAIIQGYVSTTFLNKEESKSIFPDTITIGE